MNSYSFGALPSRPCFLAALVAYLLSNPVGYLYANEIQFNTDVLDIKDRENIDLQKFSRSGYIMPGEYSMVLRINSLDLPEQPIQFYPQENSLTDTQACITHDLVEQFGLKDNVTKKLTWWHQKECLTAESIPGMTAKGDIGSGTLFISLPQAYLEYVSPDWDPPSQWDNGIPGLLFDYYVNTQVSRQEKNKQQSYNASGNGTLGANLGAWRLRADWQARAEHQNSGQADQREWDWSRYYAYRALPRVGAKLTVGEDFLYSDIFDSFRYTGATLATDDSMLPPNLRGYAPEVTGIARTNAKVTISQQGRVIYETQVAQGPFRIQDLNDAVSGQLNVRVEELDGGVQQFNVDTASIPYLTRPGQLRYKFTAGRPSDWQHQSNGPMFASGEFSWGVSNGWSLYGGGVAGGDYNSLALGIGRDLMMLGALSFDATQSRATLPDTQGTLSGGSYRLSYSKRFDDYDSQVTFAGYRFSEQDFMSMSEFLDARTYGTRSQNSKEMYTISFSQQLRDLGMSAYLNYSHQTYWDQPANDRYSLSLSRYFDIGRIKNLTLSLSANSNKYNGQRDDSLYLSLSMPWGNRGSISYSGTQIKDDNTHQVNFYNQIDRDSSYQLSTGVARNGGLASGYYSHNGSLAKMNVNASYREGSYSSAGMSMQGGATATAHGAALHRATMIGGTRMMLDTNGVADIPLQGYGSSARSNYFGKAVIADINSYYRSRVNIDLNTLPANADASRSVVQATLTEGAIGYRRFNIIAGEKAMAVIRLEDGTAPPFGATVFNIQKQEVGIVNDDGNVYLSGINPKQRMTVQWAGKEQCELIMPAALPAAELANLLLPCHDLQATP